MDRRLLALAIGMFALGTDNFVVAGVLQQISQSFHVSIEAAGQMATVYAVTLALLAPTIAALAAGVPRKTMLLTGMVIFVIANLGTAYAPTFTIALIMRALAGVGAAMFSPTAASAAAVIVPPERRGFALSVVTAGMTISTALGSPAGALIGGLGDWRWTMVFVAGLALVSFLGVAILLTKIPLTPPVSLSKRLAPLADARIGLTLMTTWLFMCGAFTIYVYFTSVFARAIGHDATMLSGLLVLWGVAGTVSNLLGGRLIDRVGAHKVLVTMLALVAIDVALLPWASATLWTAIPAIIVWGACGWGVLVPQQYRLVMIAPALAPVVIGLSNSAAYLGLSSAGVIGALGIAWFGNSALGFVAAGFSVMALVFAQLAARLIAHHERRMSGAKFGWYPGTPDVR
jgi:DHA1 family inner membrane transport protein